jgi:molecular chaperone GrpE
MNKENNKHENTPETAQGSAGGTAAPEKPETAPQAPEQQADNELQGLRSQLLRLKAEFDNYRRRVEKEKEMQYLYGKQSVLMKIVSLMDIFNNALKHTEDSQNIQQVKHGIKLLHKEFSSFISKEGIDPIPAVGKKFDPERHEIVGLEETGEDGSENMILHEVQQGFASGDWIIRPSRVIVSKKKEKTENPKPAEGI